MDVPRTPAFPVAGRSGPVNDANHRSMANGSGGSPVGRPHRRSYSQVRPWGVAAVLILLAVAVTGCGSGTTPPSSSSSVAASSASSTAKAAVSSASSTAQEAASTSYPAGTAPIYVE